MKILVTGSKGFIGTHLIPVLRQAGHDIIALDRSNGDLSQPYIIDMHLEDESPDVVVHLAAKTSRILCEADPGGTVRDNVVATTRVAKSCGKHGIKLVYASSSDIYGEQNGVLCDEGAAPNPINIYAMSKLWGERVAFHYVPPSKLLVLRIIMPYGPGHRPSGGVKPPEGWSATSAFLWRALHRQKIPVHANTVRSWCYIDDTVRATQQLIDHEKVGIWNVGRDDDPVSARYIAELACGLTGAPTDLIMETPVPAYTIPIKRLSVSKLLETGWRPTVMFEEGLRRTLPWAKTLPPPEISA